MNNKEKYLHILKKEIAPAIGCTEPIAVALAVAKAREVLQKDADSVDIYVSRNIFKNAMGVGVPGTGMVGLEIAAALALLIGQSQYQLEVLREVTPQAVEQAKTMLEKKLIHTYVKEVPEKLYIEAVCHNGQESATVVIRNVHTNICAVYHNGETLLELVQAEDCASASTTPQPHQTNVEEILRFAQETPLAELAFISEAIEMNLKVAREGLRNVYGVSIGKQLYDQLQAAGDLTHDVTTYAIALTCAASDARMAGCTLPVMSTAGSGNQGLTATLPVVAVAQAMEASQEAMYRAVVLSELVTIHIKTYIGKLSAICGCAIAASVGATCGITYLKGGGYDNLVYAIKNIISDISGLICDGAKSSCSLKIATAVGSAMRCSCLAMNNTVISDKDGIIDTTLDGTLENLGKLANEGMAYTDKVILDMMLCK